MQRPEFRMPRLWAIPDLYKAIKCHGTVLSAGKFHDKRPWRRRQPLSLFNTRWRLAIAWGVFTGKYDAIKWEENNG